MMKRILACLLILSIVFLCGCSLYETTNQLDQILGAAVVGIDYADGLYQVTVYVNVGMMNVSAGTDNNISPNSIVYYAEGKTVYEACMWLERVTPGHIFWGYLRYVLVGEESARNDISQCVQYFTLGNEVNSVAQLAVVQDATARELIEASVGELTGVENKLDGLYSSFLLTSMVTPVTLAEYQRMDVSEYREVYLPMVQNITTNKIVGDESGDILLEGYALFHGSRMVDKVTGDEALGVSWLLDTAGACTLVIEDENEGEKVLVSLQILEASTKRSLEIIDGLPVLTFKVFCLSYVTDPMNDVSGTEQEFSELLNQKVEDIVRSAYGKITENASDIMDISNMIYVKDYKYWNEISENWDEIYRNMQIEISCESVINNIYRK